MSHTPLLDVRNLQISLDTNESTVQAVRGISFTLQPGETVALVGESGCGKSMTAHALAGLLPSTRCRMNGELLLEGRSLHTLSEKEWEQVRGREIGIIFQDPLSALNPTMRIGKQITEGLRKHHCMSREQAFQKALKMLHLVGIPQPEERIKHYPHQYSGGMRQRVIIAMALACQPKLLIADEPTTSLDVTIQAQILELLKSLQKELKTSMLIITHDMGIVAGMCDRLMVMYAGRIVEAGTVQEIFSSPQHPYTRGLLKAVPPLHTHTHDSLPIIPGSPPSLASPPPGCPFWPRCKEAMRICKQQMPPPQLISTSHSSSCWLHASHTK